MSQQQLCGLQSLKYLLSSPLQKKSQLLLLYLPNLRTGGLVAEAVSSAQEENQTAFAHASSPASPFPVRL